MHIEIDVLEIAFIIFWFFFIQWFFRFVIMVLVGKLVEQMKEKAAAKVGEMKEKIGAEKGKGEG